MVFALLLLLPLVAQQNACFSFASRKLVYIHIMKTGGLSIDALLKCRCASAETPCALLREDGSAKHASNASGDLITRFRDSMLHGRAACAGGPVCTASGVGAVPMDEAGAATANAKAAAVQRVSRRDVGRKVTHAALLESRGGPCSAQVLATHQSIAAIRTRPYWAGAHTITVLRDPVARVWSFYQYVRRKSFDFQSQPLLHFLRRWRNFTPNASAASTGGGSPHWHWRKSNPMPNRIDLPCCLRLQLCTVYARADLPRAIATPRLNILPSRDSRALTRALYRSHLSPRHRALEYDDGAAGRTARRGRSAKVEEQGQRRQRRRWQQQQWWHRHRRRRQR